MRNVSGYMTRCPACEKNVDVDVGESGKSTISQHRDPKTDQHCAGSQLGVPDRLVTAVRV